MARTAPAVGDTVELDVRDIARADEDGLPLPARVRFAVTRLTADRPDRLLLTRLRDSGRSGDARSRADEHRSVAAARRRAPGRERLLRRRGVRAHLRPPQPNRASCARGVCSIARTTLPAMEQVSLMTADA